jgi:hypothetical protein
MFDNIKCEYKLLDLPQEVVEAWRGVENVVFQTKDTPNQYMCLYKIDHDGILWEEQTEKEWVESTTPDAEWFLDRIGHMKTISRTWVKTDFSGSINFYECYNHKNYKAEYNQSDSEDWQKYELGWIEYKALFHNGSLISMDLAKNEKPIELTDEQLYNKREKIKELRKNSKK